VEDAAELRPTLEKALASNRPNVVNIMISAQSRRKPQQFEWLTR
jgi:thiamine pyrophosphate-dependent acetolactate synthase large subunit-like protein